MKTLPPAHTRVRHIIVGIDKLTPSIILNLKILDITAELKAGAPGGYEVTFYYGLADQERK